MCSDMLLGWNQGLGKQREERREFQIVGAAIRNKQEPRTDYCEEHANFQNVDDKLTMTTLW